MDTANINSWLKPKGYLHITPQIDVERNAETLITRIKNKDFISKYAFYPLIHANIHERRYKRIAPDSVDRYHSYIDKNGKPQKNKKTRPLHYASHFDALIFAYYADLLQTKYENRIHQYERLSDSIIAYRKIPSEIAGKHKSTIHFANEIFGEIRCRSIQNEDCSVLTFDIKSFFSSLNHELLKTAWADLLELDRLPADHYNVFKASTQFSYILLDDLRISKKKNARKAGFNEKELAAIRNIHGINAFFASPKDFRNKVKEGSIKLYKYPFRSKESKQPIGIPQGLPISAVLANLYLLNFDLAILNEVVNKLGGYYRRYSDDIVVVCSTKDSSHIESFITQEILNSKVEISINKTEKFIFRNITFGRQKPRLTSVKILKDKEHISAPFIYLGFEFNGQKALIKSANLAKFYRRMISSVKSKAKRAKKMAEKNPGTSPVLFRRQLYKLYTSSPLKNITIRKRWKKLIKTKYGNYKLITGIKNKVLRSNYLSYVERASTIMNEPAISKQIAKHKTIFNQAIHKHLKTN